MIPPHNAPHPRVMKLSQHILKYADARTWVNWRYSTNKAGGVTKVPVCPETGRYASTGNSASWSNLFMAQRRYVAPVAVAQGAYDFLQRGIGFVHTRGCPIFTIDIDTKKLPADSPGRKAAVELEKELNTLSIISPSGRGLHIHGYCYDQNLLDRIGEGRIAVQGFIDLFGDHGYVTMTENVYRDVEMKDCTSFLRWFLDKHDIQLRPPVSQGDLTNTAEYGRSLDLTDAQVIAKLSAKYQAAYRGELRDPDGGTDKTMFYLLSDLDKISGSVQQVYRILMTSPFVMHAGKSPSGNDRYARMVRRFEKEFAKCRGDNNRLLQQRESVRELAERLKEQFK